MTGDMKRVLTGDSVMFENRWEVLTGDSVTFENRWEVSGGLSMGVASGALMSSEALMSERGVGDWYGWCAVSENCFTCCIHQLLYGLLCIGQL